MERQGTEGKTIMGKDEDIQGQPVPVKQTQRAIVPDDDVMLKARVRLSVTRLFRGFLFTLEELATEHDDAMGKLNDALPPNLKGYVDLADYWTDAKMDNLRRKVLGAGNDVIREIEQQIDQLKR